ncbi:hypothetical protein TNCV_1675571 [Trichonephila clavipes]|nr:hypothetical protein TNCV_1675571 [Trichonephila clavipes]
MGSIIHGQPNLHQTQWLQLLSEKQKRITFLLVLLLSLVCDAGEVIEITISYGEALSADILSYKRAFGNGPRNFKPWSSDEDDT